MLHENRWQGPAIVIGQDNKIVIVKHGNIISRVHPCNLRLKTPEEIIGGTENEIGPKATSLNTENNQQNITIATNKLENNDDEQFIPDENVDDVPKRVESNNNTENIPKQSGDRIESIPLPKRNENAMYRYLNENKRQTVNVLGRAGYSKGKNKNWLNVPDKNHAYSLNWSDVAEWKINPDIQNSESNTTDQNADQTYVTNLVQNNNEFLKWKHFNVYREVPDQGQERINGRWVCTKKTVNGKEIPKARYVIKDFQEHSEVQADSPTGSKESVRLLLPIISSHQWTLSSIDTKAAFLQEKDIYREMFISCHL